MKKLLTLFTCAILLFGCEKQQSTKQEVTNLTTSNARKQQTKITVGKGRYKTIASIYGTLGANTIVTVLPGTYDEQLILVSDVTFILDGVTLNYTAADSNGLFKPAVTNNGVTVTNCVLSGAGTLQRSNSYGAVVEVDNGSQVSIENSVTINDDPVHGALYGAIYVIDGNVDYNGTINATGNAAQVRKGTLAVTGTLDSKLGHGLLIGGNAGVCSLNGNSFSHADYVSAIELGSGNFTLEGQAIADKYFGFQQSGGMALLKNSHIESKADLPYRQGDAISYSYGDGLTLDNCTLKTFNAFAYSISGMGTPLNVTLLSDCFANKPKSDEITLTGTGQLIIQ